MRRPPINQSGEFSEHAKALMDELCVAPILVANTITVRSYASLHLFDSTETYTFTLSSSSATWNIGAAGQLKAELIAMC
jgi:hypothetical protein